MSLCVLMLLPYTAPAPPSGFRRTGSVTDDESDDLLDASISSQPLDLSAYSHASYDLDSSRGSMGGGGGGGEARHSRNRSASLGALPVGLNGPLAMGLGSMSSTFTPPPARPLAMPFRRADSVPVGREGEGLERQQQNRSGITTPQPHQGFLQHNDSMYAHLWWRWIEMHGVGRCSEGHGVGRCVGRRQGCVDADAPYSPPPLALAPLSPSGRMLNTPPLPSLCWGVGRI